MEASVDAVPTSPSRWQVWRSLEPRSDRLASLGALGLGLVGLAGLFLFL